jgi:hypothetical protein
VTAATAAGNRTNHCPFGIFTPNPKSGVKNGSAPASSDFTKYSVEKIENS